MRLYHSSNVIVEHPDVQHSRNYLDFGRGFYLTSIHEQAVRYAQRFKRRGQPAWLNVYELADDLNVFDKPNPDELARMVRRENGPMKLNKWNVRYFDVYDKEWLDFVAQCRDGKDVGDYDMVIGGIANDRVIITLDRYFAGEISQEETLGLLRFEKPNIQYCIRNERMLNECITYIESQQL